MADVVDRKTRSRMMAGIGGRDTKPELTLRRALHAAGLRFRLHARDLPGRPDIVLPRHRAAIFVHGCFWHRHQGCHWRSTPSSNQDFWNAKFARNVERDAEGAAALHKAGWRVATVWECGLRRENVERVAVEVAEWVMHGGEAYESALVRPKGTT